MAAHNTTYGYARVSTADQNLDLQLDALKAYGCTAIKQEKASAAKERPVLNKLLTALRPGDTLVVWRLDRLGRSLKHLVDLVTGFQEQGIHFVSLQDNLNTSTASGRLVFGIFASLAAFELELIRERTHAGLTAARARGRVGGRPSGLSKEALAKAEAAKTLYLKQDKTVGEIGKLLGIGRATVYRYLTHLGVPTGGSVAPTDFKFKVSAPPAALVGELDNALQEVAGVLPPTPINQLAPAFLRDCLVKVPVTGPFPNEWTAWCFARRTPAGVLQHHQNLPEVALEHGVDTDKLADKLSALCGELYYTRLGGVLTAMDLHQIAKMNNEMGGDWVKLPPTPITPKGRGRKS